MRHSTFRLGVSVFEALGWLGASLCVTYTSNYCGDLDLEENAVIPEGYQVFAPVYFDGDHGPDVVWNGILTVHQDRVVLYATDRDESITWTYERRPRAGRARRGAPEDSGQPRWP